LYECTKELILSTKKRRTVFARRGNLACFRRHKIQTAAAQAAFAEAEKPAAASAAAPPDATMMLTLDASTAQSRQDDRRCHQDDARRLGPRRASFACIVTGGPALLARDAFKALLERGAWTGSCALRQPPCVQFQCHDRANW